MSTSHNLCSPDDRGDTGADDADDHGDGADDGGGDDR